MREELATPLMACAHAALRMPNVDVEIGLVAADDGFDVRSMQRIAFGQPALDVSAERVERTLVGRIDGKLAAAAGLAGALTAAPVQAGFDEGAELCVLCPGDETAMRLYECAASRAS